MKITVNGQLRDIVGSPTVADYLEQLGLDPERMAIERNRAIVPREAFAATRLAEGDQLEIIQFVGGG